MTPHPFTVLRRADDIPLRLKGGVVAIGNFDGVHRGHQAVIGRTIELAAARNVPALALTFEPHPRAFFRPADAPFRITPEPVKLKVMGATGLDAVKLSTFDGELAGLDAEAFVQRIIAGRLGAAGVVVGFDFHFGRGRSGTPEVLLALGERHGFFVERIGAFNDEGGQLVSSSAIREALQAGDIAAANAMLGWRWFVEADVVHGDKRGRTLGFPTANMRMPADFALAHGVYAVRVKVDGQWRDGAANYGRRPQFDHGAPVLETHLMDFSGDLYGRPLEVEFHAFLRPELKFASVEALVDQMKLDCIEASAAIAGSLAVPRPPVQAMLDEM